MKYSVILSTDNMAQTEYENKPSVKFYLSR